jgi:hypothetical protein
VIKPEDASHGDALALHLSVGLLSRSVKEIDELLIIELDTDGELAP